MKQRGFSFPVFIMTFSAIALVLFLYGHFAMDVPPGRILKYAVSEGNFPRTVALTGIAGYLTYKYFDLKNRFVASKSALGAMFLWFLILLAVKYLFK